MTRAKEINIYITSSNFEAFFRKFSGEKNNYDFSGISDLRKILNKEKARIIHTIKTHNPPSLYALSKLLNRDFKAVKSDIDLLQKFGFISLVSSSKGKRKMLKPELNIDELIINLKFK